MVRTPRIFAVLAALWTLLAPSVAHAQDPAWWNTNWSYRQKLSLNDAGISADLTDFPVMVQLDASRVDYSQFKTDGSDVRFVAMVNSSLTVLSYEVEHWDPAGTSTFWVKLPTLTSGGSPAAVIWLYWGNGSAASAADTTGTWNSHYKAVWHFESLDDSTSSAANLTASATPTQGTGSIGHGEVLDGTYYLSAPDTFDLGTYLATSNSGTLELWIKTTTQTGGSNGAQSPGLTGVNSSGGGTNDAYWGWLDSSGQLGVQYDNGTAQMVDPSDHAWHYVVFRHNGKALSASMDGSAFAADVNSGNSTSVTAFHDLGHMLSVANSDLLASIDEVRILDTEVDSNYAKATWASECEAAGQCGSTNPVTSPLIDWCTSGTQVTFYVDADHDGYGSSAPGASTVVSCTQPYGYAANADDCDDGNAAINPNTVWYVDADYDGHGSTSTYSGGPQCADPSDATCSDPTPSGNCYVTNSDDCSDSNGLTWDTCGTCVDNDADGAWYQCNTYNAKGEDCDDGNNRTWDTCGTCKDNDGDTWWAGCNAYPNGDGPDYCDGSSTSIIDANNWTDAACNGGCADHDGDGAYSGCDSYLHNGIVQDFCDGSSTNIIDFNNWTQTACTGGCADHDGDNAYSGCDRYSSITQDFCDDPALTFDLYNWTDAACNGGCVDVDSDGHWAGCDSYDLSDPSSFPQDFCDQNTVIGAHQWSSACSNCVDKDVDTYYVGCDLYDNALKGPDCNDNDFAINPATKWYHDEDSDGDGSKTAYSGNPVCQDPSTDCGSPYPANNCYSVTNTDCDDTDPTVNSRTRWYIDADYDGFGDETDNGTQSCTDPSVSCSYATKSGTCYVRDNTDCNDGDAAINPNTVWYLDNDHDGFGSRDPTKTFAQCTQPSGYVSNHTDCDDNDPAHHVEDTDGISWADETAAGSSDCSDDSDNDHVPDAIEWGNLSSHTPKDTDNDGIPDIIDPDDDGDHVPTVAEDYSDGAGGPADGDPTNDDTDKDGTPDYLDPDDDGDTILTKDEDTNHDGDPTNDNVDGDLLPNYLDPDDDNDRIPTKWEVEAGSDPYSTDSDNDTVPDNLEWGDLQVDSPRDSDGDGIPDILDTDDDNDGIPTKDESPDDLDGDATCVDVGDGFPSYIDVDSDGDGYCDKDFVPAPGVPEPGGPCVVASGVDRDPTKTGVQEILETLTDDYDSDGVPNVYDCADTDYGLSDTDGDGISNADELAAPCYTDPGGATHCLDPARRDTDGDGVPDGIEVGPDIMHPKDTDGDGIPDWWDLDDDGDSVPTALEDYTYNADGTPKADQSGLLAGDGDPTNDDTDKDGIPDYLDTDDDGDGIPTIDEDVNGDGNPRDDDTDGDFIPNYVDANDQDGPRGDLDGDGVTNAEEDAVGADKLSPDSDNDGVLDGVEYVIDDQGHVLDSDQDGVPDIIDQDDDGDGIPTFIEGTWDADHDGIPNYLDLDSDGDGLSDRVEGGNAYEAGDPLPDSDGDGIPDFLDASTDVFGTPQDTNRPPTAQPGCACNSVPAPAGGFAVFFLVTLVGVRRRRRGETRSGPTTEDAG